jgi:hypothetical protein
MGRPKKYDKPRLEYVIERAKIVFKLLLHHPYFLSECLKIRKKFKISENGERTEKEADKLFRTHKRHLSFYKEVYDLIDKFNYPIEFDELIFGWVKDYIVFNKKIPKGGSYHAKYATGDCLYLIGIKPNNFYIEITPNTTLKDVKKIWKEITDGLQEENSANHYKFNVQKVSEFGERLYELTEEGYSRREAVEIINREKGNKFYTWNNSSNSLVHNALNKYKRRLNELREI